jgi:hypothetical protein
MDNEAGERYRGRTLELKGEGQGFTLRGYPIVLKETVIWAIKILKHDVTKAGVVTVSPAALLKSIRKYKNGRVTKQQRINTFYAFSSVSSRFERYVTIPVGWLFDPGYENLRNAHMPLVTKVVYNLEVIKRNQPDKYHISGTKKKLIYIVTYQIDTTNVVILV